MTTSQPRNRVSLEAYVECGDCGFTHRHDLCARCRKIIHPAAMGSMRVFPPLVSLNAAEGENFLCGGCVNALNTWLGYPELVLPDWGSPDE